MTPESAPTFHIREICPKDFYFAQILRQKEEGQLPLLLRLIQNPEVLDQVSIAQARAVFNWAAETLLDKNLFTVENWLEVSFHLCKQRWDSSMDWLEQQPMSKIQAMIQVVQNFAEEQEKEAKKASRKKR